MLRYTALDFMKYIKYYQTLLCLCKKLKHLFTASGGDVQSGTTNTPQISRGGLHRTPDIMFDFFHWSPLSVIWKIVFTIGEYIKRKIVY